MAKSSTLSVFTMLQLLMLLCCSVAYKNFREESSIVYTYNRVAEIEKHCTPYLTSSSKSVPDDNRGYTLERELSFTDGDWNQENGGFPLMPFDESDLQGHRLLHRVDPLQLVSFQVQDINIVHHFENASVNVGGILSLGISRNTTFFPSVESPSFTMMPGFSVLTAVFEGVYLESEESGGDRLLCLLGNAALPISEPHVEYWDITNSHWSGYSHQPRLLQDDQILLVLRYPQTFNLTSRAIKGEIRSLNKHGSLNYFDNVHISSQLSRYSKYQFSPELMPRSCYDKHFCQEEWSEYDALTFIGSEFCKTLQSISGEPFNVIPNYKFNDRYAYQSKLGPLQPGKEFGFANWRLNHEDLRLVLQHVICEEETTLHNAKNARISATLRVFPASIPADTARERTGLSNLTLLAEGTWDFSSGKLCMIGCSGELDSVLEECNYQISLYFPQVYSIKQRSLMLGSISSIVNEPNTFFPLLINYAPRPVFLHLSLGPRGSYLAYNYSMIQLATSIRRKNQPSKFRLLKQSSFLKYPALEDQQDVLAQLRFLSTNLNFDAYAICKHCLDKHNSRVFIHMDVFSLGPLFGPYVSKNDGATKPAGAENFTNTQILNISLHLIFNEGSSVFTIQQYRHLSPLFLEGVYDPLAGQMYLIGCRMVSISNVSTNVGHGLDCLVDVKVQYPPLAGRWLKNPSVEMTITSQRPENDPLHFKAVTLQTDIVPYLKHQVDVAFRKLFERVFKILISCTLVGIIFSQLNYMKRNAASIPHISLVMVAEQILGYGAELFRDTEILLESKESAAYRDLSHDYKHILNPLEIITRLLVLVALLITIRLYKEVSEAKKRSNAYGSNKEKRLPQHKNVLLWNLKVHIVVCLVLTGLLAIELSLRNNIRSLGLIDFFLLPGILIQQVQMHVLWAQGFFLVPQALQKSVWQSKVKPLRKMYYVGLTLLRLIIYSYDYVRDPILAPYSDNGDFNRRSSNFFSMYGITGTAIPIIMVLIATVVHIQQSDWLGERDILDEQERRLVRNFASVPVCPDSFLLATSHYPDFGPTPTQSTRHFLKHRGTKRCEVNLSHPSGARMDLIPDGSQFCFVVG
ncbi:hypothetical protein CR513_31997, partial [Mucuna pruriens]